MAKFISLIIIITSLFSCNENFESEATPKEIYPDTMSLWKVISNQKSDNELYFFFPNDSTIMQYELRNWTYYSENTNTENQLSDFHSNDIFLKNGKEYAHFKYFWKNTSQISIVEKSNNLKLKIKDESEQYYTHYFLEQVEDYDALPADPRKTWFYYFNTIYNDTLVRFKSDYGENQIIYSYRGEDIVTLELEPYSGKPYFYRASSRLTESDTFFVAKGTNRVFVVSKSNTYGGEFQVNIGSTEITEINRNDSLNELLLFEKVQASLNSGKTK